MLLEILAGLGSVLMVVGIIGAWLIPHRFPEAQCAAFSSSAIGLLLHYQGEEWTFWPFCMLVAFALISFFRWKKEPRDNNNDSR